MCLKRVRNCSTLESVCKPSSFWSHTGFKIWSVRAWFCNLNQRFTCMMGKCIEVILGGTFYCCHSCFRPNRCARMGHCVFSVLLIRNTSSTWRTSKQVQFAASKIHGGIVVCVCVCVWGGGGPVPHVYRICLHIHTSVNSGSIDCKWLVWVPCACMIMHTVTCASFTLFTEDDQLAVAEIFRSRSSRNKRRFSFKSRDDDRAGNK